MSVCEELLVTFYFFSFLITSLRKPKIPYYLFLLSLLLLRTPTILTLYVNTTLVVPLFYVDESFSGSKMSGHFLIRKPRSMWPPLRNPRRYILHNFTWFIRTTEHKMIISAGWQLREAKRNQFENLHQFYLTESCYKNIFECPSYMRKIRQINGLVKF